MPELSLDMTVPVMYGKEEEKWVTIAEGTKLDAIQPKIGDVDLPVGTPVRMMLNLHLPVGPAFDLAGAEIPFRQFAPPGLRLIDVHSEGLSKAVIEYEAEGAFFLPILAFIKAHWLAIVIGGVVLLALIKLFQMGIPQSIYDALKAIVPLLPDIGLIILILGGLYVASKAIPKRRET